MPHDKNGRVVEPGQRVTVEFIVKHVHQAEDYCNVDLESVERMPGNDTTISLTAINTRQVVVVKGVRGNPIEPAP